MKIGPVSAAESRGALMLLSMAANADVNIIRDNFNLLVHAGLGPRSKVLKKLYNNYFAIELTSMFIPSPKDDERLAQFTCIALQKLQQSSNLQRTKQKVESHQFLTTRFPFNLIYLLNKE